MRTDSRDDVVFGPAWFARHQRTLLWLLNAPIIGRWFRWVLCIRSCDVGYRRVITRLYPHAYEVENPDGTITADFRTHAKYGKRLYHAFLPIWRALHWWDETVANPLIPALNAGFDTLTAYPDPYPATTCGDFFISIDGFSDDWSVLRERTSTNVLLDYSSQHAFSVGNDTTTNKWYELTRGVFSFDTRPLGGFTISAVTLSLAANGGKSDSLGITPGLIITTASPSNVVTPTGMAYADYGTTSVSGTAIAYSSLPSAGATYQDITIDTTAISTASITTLASRSSYDVSGTAPTWSAPGGVRDRSSWGIFYADQTGTATDPKLTVTYSKNALVPRNRLRPRVFAPGRAR